MWDCGRIVPHKLDTLQGPGECSLAVSGYRRGRPCAFWDQPCSGSSRSPPLLPPIQLHSHAATRPRTHINSARPKHVSKSQVAGPASRPAVLAEVNQLQKVMDAAKAPASLASARHILERIVTLEDRRRRWKAQDQLSSFGFAR